MKNWIYLKKKYSGFDEINAAALATVLKDSTDSFYVVHTNVSIYLRGLENVKIGNPNIKEGDTFTTIDLPDNTPFQILCKIISEILCLNTQSNYYPYTGFIRDSNEIDYQLSLLGDMILYYYEINQNESFIYEILECISKKMNSLNYNSVCCSPTNENLIKGAYDFRGILEIDEIIKNRERIKVIVTTVPFVKEIGILLEIPIILFSSNTIISYFGKEQIIDNTLYKCCDKVINEIMRICSKNSENSINIRVNYSEK